MQIQIEQAVAILERTPAVLNQLLRGVPDGWVLMNEGPDTWSPYDIVGHLNHGEEADWMPRAKIILKHGEARAFEPFDRFAQFEKAKGKSLDELLDKFGLLRGQSLEELRELNLTAEQMSKRGRHPDLGEVTLGQLIATWTVHDLSHISQITRVMCKQYSDAVGPWKEYLPVLTR
ncbi:MAG: DinB family protein [Pyrinomonadaceae bacterium]